MSCDAGGKHPVVGAENVEVPFEHIGIDFIVSFLHRISEKSLAQALFQVISRIGIPKEILTDKGTLFMSRMLKELYGLLDIK